MSTPNTAVILYLEERLQELRDLQTESNQTAAESEQITQRIDALKFLLDRCRSEEAANQRKPVQADDSQTLQFHAPGRDSRAL